MTESLNDGTVTPLFPGLGPRYAHSGHLLFTRPDGALLAAPFDVDPMTAIGAGTPLGPSIQLRPGSRVQLSLSRDGTLLYMSGERGRYRMVRLERDGGETYLDPDEVEEFGSVALSADGRRVVTRLALPDGSGRRIVVKSLPDGPLTALRNRISALPTPPGAPPSDGSTSIAAETVCVEPRRRIQPGPLSGRPLTVASVPCGHTAAPSSSEGLRMSAPRVVSSRMRDFAFPDVFPDDQAFLVTEPEGEERRDFIVLNFFEELRRGVPNR